MSNILKDRVRRRLKINYELNLAMHSLLVTLARITVEQ